jgi:hypothetical protein
MADEVEEFLRRVAQMRAQAEAQARAQQQRPRPAAPPPPPPPQQVAPARLVPARSELSVQEPAQAEIVDAELADSGERVGRQVARDMRGTEQIASHARQLGDEVDQADEKLEAHLHQVFDHQLGRLKKTATDQAAPAASAAKRLGFTAGSIADLLHSPENLRNAIILGEILKRPEELR